MYRIPSNVWAAFHGSPPRILRRMLCAHPNSWGHAARVPRERVQAVLRTLGLEVRLVTKEERFKVRPGRRRAPAYSYQIGEFVSLSG